jgi:hypothetical protein
MADLRKLLGNTMRATLSDPHGRWDYEAVRPIKPFGPRSYEQGRYVKADCSKGAQLICYWTAGCPDPMKQSWDGYGNSATLAMRLQHLALPSQLLVGDFVTFGPGGGSHAAVVLEPGSNPLLWSFGHPEARPNVYRLSQDPRVRQYLRNPVPIYVPTPDDRLRSMTGYWAWVQWRLGEGSWSHHSKADPKVRPNVPKLIPASWWKQLGVFLANRKKADSLKSATPRGLLA